MGQEVSLGLNDYYFRTTVTLTNAGNQPLYDVRYGRSCDPDNTKDMGGSYTTENHIATSFKAGDKFVSVSATSLPNDPYNKKAGAQAVLTYASLDKRAVPAWGNKGLYPSAGVYTSEVNTQQKKGHKVKKDAWIGMFFKLGTLKPGQSTTFSFDTWMAPATVKVDEKAVRKAKKKADKIKKKKVGGVKECKALCKKSCPGKWARYPGWTGYAVCKKRKM